MKANLNKLEFYTKTGSEIRISICRVIALLTFIGIIFLSGLAKGQTSASDNPVIKAAPHLPKMERSNDDAKLFHGEKFTYKADNEVSLKEWASKYPNEVEAYKVAIDPYLKDTDITKLSALDQDTFYDLKSQWLMAIQIIN